MNTNEVKAKIWNMCIEKGTFNKVKGEEFKEIQDLFEKIIKGYEQLQPSEEIFNKVIDSISLEIQKKSTSNSLPFETIQKEYDELLNTPIPKQIDFTNFNSNEFDKPKIKLEEILMTQNKVLIQILETQIKIIEILKK
jgi:hypothetical protein